MESSISNRTFHRNQVYKFIVFTIIMRCAICCEEQTQHIKLPCWSCKGQDKAYCFTCFGRLASYHLNTFNLIIRCPFCRQTNEFDFQSNDSIVVSQNRIPYCTLLKTSQLAIFIQRGYTSYSNTLNVTDAELDIYLNRLIDNNKIKILFKAFLHSRTRDADIGTNHDMVAPVVVLMPIPAAYITWLNYREVLRDISR